MHKQDPVIRLVKAMQTDLEFMATTLTNHVVDTNRRFGEVADGLETVARITTELSVKVRQVDADVAERFNQLTGRMRLMDQRFNTFLGAADKDRGRLESKYSELERRLTEVEKRLPPTG